MRPIETNKMPLFSSPEQNNDRWPWAKSFKRTVSFRALNHKMSLNLILAWRVDEDKCRSSIIFQVLQNLHLGVTRIILDEIQTVPGDVGELTQLGGTSLQCSLQASTDNGYWDVLAGRGTSESWFALAPCWWRSEISVPLWFARYVSAAHRLLLRCNADHRCSICKANSTQTSFTTSSLMFLFSWSAGSQKIVESFEISRFIATDCSVPEIALLSTLDPLWCENIAFSNSCFVSLLLISQGIAPCRFSFERHKIGLIIRPFRVRCQIAHRPLLHRRDFFNGCTLASWTFDRSNNLAIKESPNRVQLCKRSLG